MMLTVRNEAASWPRPWGTGAPARWLRVVPAPLLVLTVVTHPGRQLLGGGRAVVVTLVVIAVLSNVTLLPLPGSPRWVVTAGMQVFVITGCLLSVAAPGSSGFVHPF